jgi:hypothetical protein
MEPGDCKRIDFTSDKLCVKSLNHLGKWSELLRDKMAVRGISVTEKAGQSSTEGRKAIAEAKVTLCETRVNKRDVIEEKLTANRTQEEKDQLKEMRPAKTLSDALASAKTDFRDLEQQQIREHAFCLEIDNWVELTLEQDLFRIYKGERVSSPTKTTGSSRCKRVSQQ